MYIGGWKSSSDNIGVLSSASNSLDEVVLPVKVKVEGADGILGKTMAGLRKSWHKGVQMWFWKKSWIPMPLLSESPYKPSQEWMTGLVSSNFPSFSTPFRLHTTNCPSEAWYVKCANESKSCDSSHVAWPWFVTNVLKAPSSRSSISTTSFSTNFFVKPMTNLVTYMMSDRLSIDACVGSTKRTWWQWQKGYKYIKHL